MSTLEIASEQGDSQDLILTFLLRSFFLGICFLLGYMLISALVYGMMQLYAQRENRLIKLTFKEFKPLLLKYMGKSFRIMLFYFTVALLLGIVIGGLALLSLWTLVLTLLLFAVLVIISISPMAMFVPIYLFEDRPFFESLNRAFRYGMSFWFEIFGVIFVFGLIAGLVNTVTYLPWYLVVVVGQVFSLASPETGINQSIWYQFLVYILGIIQSYGAYISQIITMTGIAFEYFHIREKREGITVKTNISNFANL